MKGFNRFKKTLPLLGFICLSLVISKCGGEESFYDVPASSRYFYFVGTKEPTKIKLIEIPSNNIVEVDAYFKANGESLDTIANIIEYGESLFILQMNLGKVTIVNSRSLSKIDEIKFFNRNPIGIAFPNATTAFVSFSNHPGTDVIDLTNNKIARSIQLPFNSGKTISVGFYVFILHPYNNAMTIIDSRTFSIVQTISLPDLPIDIEASSTLDYLYVLCVGNGKIDTTQTKTPAKVVVIPISDFSQRNDFEITVGTFKSIDIIPYGLSISNKYFGYVATKQGLLRFYLNNPSKFQKLLLGDFIYVNYNYKSNEILVLESKNEQTIVYLANPINFSITTKFILNQNILIFLPK